MKLKKLLFCCLTPILFLASCASAKKVTLEPVVIKANSYSPGTYHPAYLKVTDIINTKLDLSFNWDSTYVYGTACIRARPYFYPSKQASFNAKGFRIREVSMVKNDVREPLKYVYDGKVLTIYLDREYNRDQEYTVFIDYVAMPYKLKIGKDIASAQDRGLYFINPDGKDKTKPRQIWSQGETECNSSWFPTIDGPQEKMTQEISLTVPDNMVSLSNGILTSSKKNGNGTHTDTWTQDKPHSTYLTMIAAGDFVIIRDKWRDREVSYYMEPAYAPYAHMIFGKTPEMIEFFSKKTGVDFQWSKYSQIVVRDFVSGAMENTTATVLFDQMNMTDGEYMDESYEDIVSHELFHHWFGDLVTAESWSNLPLNESFATYGEYLWNEYKYGRDEADYQGMTDMLEYFDYGKGSQLNVVRFDYSDKEEMFDQVTYQKGGRILHMLRKTVGDDAFFKSLNLYLTRNSYKNAEIHDLRLAFEEVTGQDLNWFFNEWFLSSGHPVLDIKTVYDQAAAKVRVIIRQTQNRSKLPAYRIPMAIDIYSGGLVKRENVTLDQAEQTFEFPASEEPQLVNVDAEKYILAQKTETKTLKQYIFQYENAPMFMDRFEAITALKSMGKDESARTEIMKAINDKHWYIRQIAIEYIPQLNEKERTAVYPQVREIALNDPRSLVRAEAIITLKKAYPHLNNKPVFDKAAKDKAPSVIKALKN